MMNKRILAWDGCNNVRDLGGLRTKDGRTTRWGTIVRSDHPARLSAAGWSSLYAYGVRTIISLRTYGLPEDELEIRPPYPDLIMVPVAIEDMTDTEFVQQWANSGLWCTPLYYRDALQRWPERHAAAISAIAQSQPGGVLIHCHRGNDRTGILTLLLLALADVPPDEMIADYELSQDPERDELLRREHSSIQDAIRNALAGLDVVNYLLKGGASRSDVAAIRARLLE